MNNEMLNGINGVDTSWIKSQLKRLEQDKVKQIEQLQAENKKQKTTIELLRKELLRLKSGLSELVKSVDEELINDEKEINEECAGTIKELDLDRNGIQSSLPILLEQYNEFKENGYKQVERQSFSI